MEELKISRVIKALGLKRQIIGVKFIVFESEYDINEATEQKHSCFCEMVNRAGNGEKTKINAENLIHLEDAYAVGILPVPEEVQFDRKGYQSGMYDSLAIARNVFSERKYIPQKIYGIEISPLIKMGDADLALIIGTAKNMMRIMQGYVLYHGVAKNIVTTGNGEIGDELMSIPFINNDINISLLNTFTRENGNFFDEEMGTAMPIHQFSQIMDGVLNTVNLTENNRPKRDILSRLNYPEELGFEIKMNFDYAIKAREYQKYWDECSEKESGLGGEKVGK